MNSAPSAGQVGALERLRARCRGLGLPCWRVDSGGSAIEEPVETGAAGLWLRSGPIGALVEAAAREWVGKDPPALTELFPGCWLIWLPIRHRRKTVGALGVMAMGIEAIDGPEFDRACAAANIDPSATRGALEAKASWDERSARTLSGLLAESAGDLDELDKDRSKIDGFTRHLTESYENFELLYRLGRSMNQVRHPAGFVRHVIDELASASQFGWIAVRLPEDARLPGELSGQVFTRASQGHDPQDLHEAATALAGTAFEGSHTILSEGLPMGLNGQAVVHTISHGDRVSGHLLAGGKGGDDPQISSYDTQLFDATASFLATFIDNACLYAEQHQMFLGTIRALTAAIDAKDRYTRGHSERVAHMAQRLAIAAGLSPEDAEEIHIAGLVHDVGKIGVPEAVLCKAGRLTDEEFGHIRKHPELGYGILKDIPSLREVLPGVMHHHERWDGKGYPHGLAGEAIPLMARIIGLADTFDAMSSTRSYRPAMERSRVLAEVERCAGTQFDPELARVFGSLDFAEYDRLVALHKANEPPPAMQAAA